MKLFLCQNYPLVGQSLIFSIAMDADHSFYVKNIEAYVLQFFSLISDGLDSVFG